MRRRSSLLSGVAASLVAFGVTTNAGAFCRARTCDATDPAQHCQIMNGDCVVTGHLLHWPTGCVTFDVQRDGSPLRGIDANAVNDATTAAFLTWKAADCGGAQPALEVGTYGPVVCNESTYNQDGKNANIVMFRDDSWPYPNSIDAYALTTVRFDPNTGEILDADIEVNSSGFDIVTDGSPAGVDLQSILTHEVGHFLGMAHTPTTDTVSTMRPGWNGVGTGLRSLSTDDEAGICDIYPPGTAVPTTCEPRHGFASECNVPVTVETAGCSVRPARQNADWTLSALLLAAVVGYRRRTRRA
jgi:hypothetical protein